MQAIRRFVHVHRQLAALVCIAALALRLLIPGGYMIAPDGSRITVTVCSGTGPATMTLALPGVPDGHAPDTDRHDRAGTPCAFAGLAAPTLAAVDATSPAIAIAAVAAVAVRTAPAVAPRLTLYLRPPSRGPPTLG